MNSNKKVVEEVSGWLKIFDDGTVDRTYSGPPEVEFLSKSVPPHEEFIDGVATRDVTIDPNTGLAVRIYIPDIQDKSDGKPDKLPLILHFHGGGFCISQPDWFMYYNFYKRVVPKARAVCVSVYLPLAPEHRLPSACDAAYSAFLWLLTVARGESSEPWLETYADFKRVFLLGDSTGGIVVHDLAVRAGKIELDPVRLAGGIGIHSGFNREESKKAFMELPESPLLTRDMVDKFMALALPVGGTKDHPILSPMGKAAPPLAELKLPAMLICVGETDLLHDTQIDYCEAMKAAGKEIEVLVNSGVGHSFYFDTFAYENDPNTKTQTNLLIEGITNFINKH